MTTKTLNAGDKTTISIQQGEKLIIRGDANASGQVWAANGGGVQDTLYKSFGANVVKHLGPFGYPVNLRVEVAAGSIMLSQHPFNVSTAFELSRQIGLLTKIISSSTYLISEADHGYQLLFNVACSVTVPPYLRDDFSCNWSQEGTGSVTFIFGPNTVSSVRAGFTPSPAQYSEGTLKAIGANLFRLIGDGLIGTYSSLGPATSSFTASDTPGTVISAPTGLLNGEKIVSISPNDGRMVPAKDGSSVVVGLSASSAGTINASFTTNYGRSLAQTVTVYPGGSIVLRQNSSNSTIPQGMFTAGATTLRVESRTKDRLIYPCVRFKLGYVGYQSGLTETNVGNTVPIQAAIDIGGTPVQVKFGGVNQGSVPNGATDYQSDWINASDFALSQFPALQAYTHRLQIDSISGNKFPYTIGGYQTGDSSVSSDGTGASQLLSTAALTGTVFNAPVRPSHVIAELTDGQIAVISVGTSIDFGQGGVAGSGGYINYGLNAANLPYIKMGVQTSWAAGFNANNAKRKVLYKYASHGYSGFDTNGIAINGRTAAQSIADMQQVWTDMKTGGIRHVENGIIIPRTTSASTNFTSDADQTPISGFEIGGTLRDPVNNGIIANVGANGLDGYLDVTTAVRSSTAADKFVSTGASRYATIDGIHPTDVIHQAMGALLNTRARQWT